MKAPELTELAVVWLRARFPDAHIRRELALGAYGAAQIDVAAICPDQIVGVEIKGDGDSPSRLKLQGAMYGRVCRQVYLLPSPSLLEKCDKQKPPEWVMLYPPSADRNRLTKCEDSGILYPTDYRTQRLRRGAGLGLAPAALVDVIWASEISSLRMRLPDRGNINWPKQKSALVDCAIQHFTLPEIEFAVCKTLLQRSWFDSRTLTPSEEAA